MEKTTGGMNKFPAMVLYIIAVVCLLAGFCVPLNASGFGGVEDMLIVQLPNALGSLFGFSLSTPAFTYSQSFTFFGLFESINLYAILVLLYAIITIITLAGLVVVCATKKDSTAAIKFAAVIEAVDAVILGIFVVCEFVKCGMGELDYWKYNMIGAFAGVLLMLVIHAIVYKKGSGVIKFVLLLISSFALVVTFVYSYNYLASLEFVDGITDKLNVADLWSTLFLAPSTLFASGEDPLMISLKVCLLVFVGLLLLNAFLDMIGLAKTTCKSMLSANLARYTVALLSFISIVILLPLNNLMIGCDLLTIGILILASLIINIVRYSLYAKSAQLKINEAIEAEKAADTTEVADESVAPATVANEDKAEEVVAKETAEPVKETAETVETAEADTSDYIPFGFYTAKAEKEKTNEDYIYRVGPLYHGPSDSFIDTLTNGEKVEFAKVFLERNKDALEMIPSYVIDEDNTAFFSAIFIYYGKVRDLVSSGLMSKIYNYSIKR